MRIAAIAALIIFLGIGCASEDLIVEEDMKERITFVTADNFPIIGDYYQSEGDKFAILLHMMPATKESWEGFAEKLVEAGYSVIAIDERGHGESTKDGAVRFEEFTDEEQQAKMHDVRGAMRYLEKEHGATEEKTVVIGASIGANLAIQFLAERPKVSTAVALSPGLDYRGIMTEPLLAKLGDDQKIVLVVSKEDEYSHISTTQLHNVDPDKTVLYEFENLGHGTTMLMNRPKTMDELIAELP